ncbi:MAG: YfgM family protein [Halothiobacillaceae bacterium]
MRDIGTDDEQLDALRAWWAENGRSVIAGVVLAVAGLVGWTGYGEWREHTLNQAALAWQQLETAIERGDTAAVDQAAALSDRYKSTPYADLARLAEARLRYDAEGADATMAVLAELAGDARQKPVRDIARLRLARMQWQADRPEEALTTLDGPMSEAFQTQREELRGDILRTQGDFAAARAAYDRALAAAPETADVALLRLKRDDLPAG